VNYLAHAILSFDEPGILAGNMISDFVKGNKKFAYPPPVQKGMALHRAIDSFTDAHETTRAARVFFKPVYRLYAGAFIDVVFDHFLAKKLAEEIDLKQKTTALYAQMQTTAHLFPAPFDSMFLHMREHDWLYNYQFHWGMERSFRGLQRRAAYIDETDTALELFQNHYTEIEKCFVAFWPILYRFAEESYQELAAQPWHEA
jgi:acyl carrier protein phosphodiesterase